MNSFLPSWTTAVAVLAFGFGSGTVRAELETQSVTLRPGWNAIQLEVTPQDNVTATVFQNLPVKSVWRYNTDASPVGFISDSSQPLPDKDAWLTWVPSAVSGAAVHTLHRIHGGACYLIDLDGTADVPWRITGQPVVRPLQWAPGAYSFTGLCVSPGESVTFAQFFAGSAAHTGQDIRRMGADGRWTSIPGSTAVRRGEAYYIFTNGISSWQGPAYVETDLRGRIEFSNGIVEQSVTLCNASAAAAAFTITPLAAATDPASPSAGAVALSLWRDGSSRTYAWETMVENGPKTVTVPAGVRKTLRLAIRRADMRGQGVTSPFRSLLRVTALGTGYDLGVHAAGFAAGTAAAPLAGRSAGLWSGVAVIRAVNEPAGANPDLMQPTASESQLRLIVRVDAAGNASLLREAMILWLDGLADADGTITEPGCYVVAGSPAELAQLESDYGVVGTGRLKGAAVRDGDTVGRRISSVGFSFTDPQPMSGSFGSSLARGITVEYNDDTNPYRHRFHPDHDNIQDGSVNQGAPVLLPEGKESFTFNRAVSLMFTSTDPEGLATAGWGDRTFGGTYQETITGLHRNPIKTSGTFRLVKVVGL